MGSASNRGIIRLVSPWPVVKIAPGMVHQGVANDTFYVWVCWRA